MADRESFIVPEGWELVTKVNSNGSVVKYYTNILGQKFYSEEDLLRNIWDAKARGLSIYAPEFDAPSFGASSSQHKKKPKSTVGEASTRVCKKKKQGSDNRGAKIVLKQKEVEQQPEMQEGKAGSRISDQSDENAATVASMFRTSRRVAGLKPELNPDFDFNKPLEYIIKDKPSGKPTT
ncbi:hypothetical protein CDL12_21568 [Handroanthus impetiginosus]|uniref:MBD domain-containing protein n=1 Tax=Handroanthus impetiginosus TaxID=429701 RepID=A0A2G9GKV7_9LAMI|nr:hypothetical protein CDL12_21568 [Handroanthus impetiginosus]